MIGKMELICVAKVDTFDGRTYEAHIRCQCSEDGTAVMEQLQHHSSIHGFEPVGCAFKPVVYKEAADYKISKDIFISCRNEDSDMSDLDAMENLSWEIENIIR